MLLMGYLDKLLVLLMLLLGMDLYIDLDLEQHSIGILTIFIWKVCYKRSVSG